MKSISSQQNDDYLYISDQGLKRLSELRDPSNPNKNFEWTTDYTLELPIKIKKNGPGSETPFTLIEAFETVISQIPDNPALRVKRNGKWCYWNYKQYYEASCNFAKALISIGLTPYSSVNIIGYNAPEWSISFFGSIFGNYLPVGIYTTNNPDGCKYISMHSEAELIVAENRVQLAKYLKIWNELPKIKYVLLYNDTIPDDLPSEYKNKVMLFNDFLELGKKFKPLTEKDQLEIRMRAQKPGNCCTLVYTSGTTGPPKGVMISHDNYTWTSSNAKKKYEFNFGTERMLSYLPLSHVASQIIDIVGTIISGSEVIFADPSALQGTLVEQLKEVRPTIFFSVPRIWEKIEEKMKAMGAQNGAIKQMIGNWAKSLGKEGTFAELTGKPVPFGYNLAKKLIYSNIKKALGLDQAKFLIFGAAPMAASTREYFLSLNFFLYNGYGMSESSGPQTATDPMCFKKFDLHALNSTGVKLEGTEMILVDVDKDGNGEICYKGRNRFMGYYKNEEDTMNTIDKNGFLHSGDVGKIDEMGNLSITGRIKELIITAGGENVAPILIENEVKEAIPFINNIMVVGEKQKYLAAILTLKYDLDQEGKLTEKLTEESLKFFKTIGSKSETFEDVEKDEIIKKWVEETMKKVNEKVISRAQQIRKWCFVQGDFTVEGGELTPTMKLKRKVANQRYQKEIDSLYLDAKL